MSRTLRNYFNYHHFYPFPLADPWKRPSRCKLLTCKAGTVWTVRINYWMERKNQGRNWMFAFVWMFMFACVWGAGGRFVVCLNKLSSSVCLQTYFTFPLSAWKAQIDFFLILLRGVTVGSNMLKLLLQAHYRPVSSYSNSYMATRLWGSHWDSGMNNSFLLFYSHLGLGVKYHFW